MSDNHLDESVSKIRQRVGLEKAHTPLNLPEAARLMLRVLDARPARLNAGLTLETQLLRAALLEHGDAGRPCVPVAHVVGAAPVTEEPDPGRLLAALAARCSLILGDRALLESIDHRVVAIYFDSAEQARELARAVRELDDLAGRMRRR